MVSPRRKTLLYERAYVALCKQMRDGNLRGGEAISELRLAEVLGMSRTPVREAIRRLLAENVLEAAPNGGVRVPLPTSDDFAEVYVTRSALEGEAARIATAIATPKFIRELESHYPCMKRAVASGSVASVIAANGKFHRCIVNFAGNKRISALLESFEHITVRYRSFSLALPIRLRQSLEDHRQLIDLISSGSAEAAAEFAHNHIVRAGAHVVRLLQGLEGIKAAPNNPTVQYLLNGAEAAESTPKEKQKKKFRRKNGRNQEQNENHAGRTDQPIRST